MSTIIFISSQNIFARPELPHSGHDYGLEDTSGLKSALEKERKARREAEQRAKLALSDEEPEEFGRLRADVAIMLYQLDELILPGAAGQVRYRIPAKIEKLQHYLEVRDERG